MLGNCFIPFFLCNLQRILLYNTTTAVNVTFQTHKIISKAEKPLKGKIWLQLGRDTLPCYLGTADMTMHYSQLTDRARVDNGNLARKWKLPGSITQDMHAHTCTRGNVVGHVYSLQVCQFIVTKSRDLKLVMS